MNSNGLGSKTGTYLPVPHPSYPFPFLVSPWLSGTTTFLAQLLPTTHKLQVLDKAQTTTWLFYVHSICLWDILPIYTTIHTLSLGFHYLWIKLEIVKFICFVRHSYSDLRSESYCIIRSLLHHIVY